MTQQTSKNSSEQQTTPKKTNQNASLHQHTMNFLYQASNFMAHKGLNIGNQFASGSNTADIQLSKHYSNNMKRIAKKNVLRLHPNIKRSLCKKCGMIFIPGKTCTITEVVNPDNNQMFTEYKCNSCQHSRRYLISALKNQTNKQ